MISDNITSCEGNGRKSEGPRGKDGQGERARVSGVMYEGVDSVVPAALVTEVPAHMLVLESEGVGGREGERERSMGMGVMRRGRVVRAIRMKGLLRQKVLSDPSQSLTKVP